MQSPQPGYCLPCGPEHLLERVLSQALPEEHILAYHRVLSQLASGVRDVCHAVLQGGVTPAPGPAAANLTEPLLIYSMCSECP